ncbi:MAG: hypothetical protein ABIX37_00920 [Gammaproteobacteria bacterium]
MGADSPTTLTHTPAKSLATTLRDYAVRYRVDVHCPRCDHEAPLNLMRWAQLVGWSTPLETLRHTLRCEKCGNNIGIELRMSERELTSTVTPQVPGY